ncbi:MAG: DUF692 family protein [Burkholderiales bacterium]|nr:DUF692 family protein [Burkholderiales bacterium]
MNARHPQAAASFSALAKPAPLGVGTTYIPDMPPELYQGGHLDYVELTVEILTVTQPHGNTVKLHMVPEKFERAMRVCGGLPTVIHGVELSIGSAHGWNEACLEMLDEFQARWPFVWHSEHLGFQTIPGENGAVLAIGSPMPMPNTEEAAQLVATRSEQLLGRYGVPFIVENPAHFLGEFTPPDQSIGDDIDLFNRITGLDRCGLLLDLHNLHCNALNMGLDPFAALDRLVLDQVLEIHVAGGSWKDGFYQDAHDGRVPEAVWELLEYTLPRAHNVAGVTFEVFERYAPRLGADGIIGEVEKARAIWTRCGKPRRNSAKETCHAA